QAPMQRTQRLPFQPVGREAVGVTLADTLGAQPLAPALLVTLRARKVELPLLLVEGPAARFEEGARGTVDGVIQRKPARFERNERLEREKNLGLAGNGSRTLALGPTLADAA